MSNNFDFAFANANTPAQDGWCLMWARQGFRLPAEHPSAFVSWQAVPQKRAGTPPNDGNYYLIYFDGYFNGQRYGDVAVYRNGQVWSGAAVRWRSGTDFNTYRNWIGANKYLGWSEYCGTKRIATIPSAAPSQPATSGSFWVRVDKAAANVRTQPRLSAPLGGSRVLNRGDKFEAVGLVKGDTVSGNNDWYKSAKGNYLWSGGLTRL